MTEGDALVFVVDDVPLRVSLTNLLWSVGLRVAAFASAQERSYWIPGSWTVRMVYTDPIPCYDP